MKIEEYAEGIGFSLNGKVYTKEMDDFVLYLKDYEYLVMKIASVYIPLDKEISKADKSMIEGTCGEACFIYKVKDLNILVLTMPEGNKTGDKFKAALYNGLSSVTKKLKELGYSKAIKCPFCKKEEPYKVFGDDFIPVDDNCVSNYLDGLKKAVDEETGFNIKYVLSIVLSFVLGLVGLMPALLLTIFNKNFFTPLAVLCPILASLGYFLAKAPNKKWLKIVTGCIVFVLIVGFASFALPYIAKAKEMDFVTYLTSDGIEGIRKIIFLTLFSLGGFGITKSLDKFKKDPKKELSRFE